MPPIPAANRPPAHPGGRRFAPARWRRQYDGGTPRRARPRARPKRTSCDNSPSCGSVTALITLQDQKNLLILLAQAPVIAFLIGLVLWNKAKFDPHGDPKSDLEQVVLFLMVIAAVWFGCSNATKEIVKELPIYKRERAINLEIMTYLLSKVTVLSVLSAVQCLALVMIILPMTGAHIPFFGSYLVIYLTALASTMMGLVVSALVDNTDKANAITPLLLIPQVVLAGCIVPLDLPIMKAFARGHGHRLLGLLTRWSI